jgi:hypothetical protein
MGILNSPFHAFTARPMKIIMMLKIMYVARIG